MKRHIYTLILILGVIFLFTLSGTAVANGIRIVPRSAWVKNDSLHLTLEMDMEGIEVNSYTALTFTPILKNKKGILELPPVVLTGGSRERFDRRERALQTSASPQAAPFRTIIEGRNAASKKLDYQVVVPYMAWMNQSALLLRQDIKDCCDTQTLGVDTLRHRLAISSVPYTKMPTTPKKSATPTVNAVVQTGKQTVTRTVPTTTSATVPDTRRTTTAVTAVVAAPTRIEKIEWSSSDLDLYIPMVSFLSPGMTTSGKYHTESAILYIDYPLGKDDIYPDYKNNREEINKIDRILSPLSNSRFSTIDRIQVRGYSSPDGPYGENERLAQARSRLFAGYIRNAYSLPRSRIDVSSVAEDWEGLKELLLQAQPSYTDAALRIIRKYGIFNGREKQLMDLQGGAPYKDMLRRFFPKLRRIEVVVEYNINKIDHQDASELIYTHPDLLSLEEMYEVARYYRPGTDQYREVYEIAAFHFPNDVTANVNAASAVMLTGDLISAWDYLRKVEADPRAWNNMGVLTLMEGNREGAASWFRKAVGVEPRKARRNLQIAEEMYR